MNTRSNKIIEIQNLDFRYTENGFRLQIPDISISEGQKIAVIGPSGCGKTTLLRLLAGINVASHGAINVDGVDISRLKDAKRRSFRVSRIGFVFQEFKLLDYLSVFENILLPFRINRELDFNTQVQERARRLAQEVGLAGSLKQKSNNLSHGEKQRLAIARALVTNPRIIMADEPTGNLDPKNKQAIKKLLFEQVSQTSSTLIFITHDHGLLDSFDQVIDFEKFVEGGSK